MPSLLRRMQLGGSSQCPPWLSAARTLADALSQPRLKVPWSHMDPLSCGPTGGARAAHPRPAALATCTASLGQRRAVLLLSLLCGESFSCSYHFCFLGRKQNKIQKIPIPMRRWSSSVLGGIYFPAFSIALLSGSIPLHSCPPWATEQKHRNDPPLSFLLLVNYFISFL